MKKPAIPSPIGLDAERVLRPMKEILEDITGQRSGELARLQTTASTVDIINKVNEIVGRLNKSGA